MLKNNKSIVRLTSAADWQEEIPGTTPPLRYTFTISKMTNHLRYRGFWSAAIPKSLAAGIVVMLCAPVALAVTHVHRPAYCRLPENVTFDRTQHPEMIGFYTGEWTPMAPILYVRRFCLLLTSIRENEVRGIYSWEAGGWDGASGWRELETANSGLFSTLRFQTRLGADQLMISIEFNRKKKAAATYTKTGKGFLGLPVQTVLQSRLVKIE